MRPDGEKSYQLDLSSSIKMAADEYYDAIGRVLSYVLSAEDFVYGQNRTSRGIKFTITRDQTNLDFFADPNKRYFSLSNRFSLAIALGRAYENDNQILRGHLERYDIDDSRIGDEDLYEKVALRRVRDVGSDEAQKVQNEISSQIVHSDCRIQNITRESSSAAQDDEELWDGVEIIGLLYPYEDDFTPRDYEQIAQEVISVGNQINEAMGKLDVMREIGYRA
jgi:hypothetical protein